MSTPHDQSPLMPSDVLVRFPGRRCSGAVTGSTPDYYVKHVSASAAGHAFTGYPATKALHENCPALFTVGVTDPTNKAALDALALQAAKDYYGWLNVAFDREYSGVLAPAVVGFYDELTVSYAYDQEGRLNASTRLTTAPWNDAPEELMHWDGDADALCTDAGNGGVPVGPPPGMGIVYGPPGKCTSGHLSLTRYLLAFVDGRLKQTYVSTDAIP